MTQIENCSFVILAVITFLFTPFTVSAQRDPLQKANNSYDKGAYREALIYYNQIDRLEQSAPLLFKRGVCYFETNQLDNALADFRTAYQFGYKNEQIDYYTGQVYHHRGDFAKAAIHYKMYLAEIPTDNPSRDRIRTLIKQCGHALSIAYQRPIAIVDPASKKINSVYDDFGALESPTVEGRLYFTSNRPNTGLSMKASDDDIYYINFDGVRWGETNRLPASINRSKDESLVGFTDAADGLYFYREEKVGGDLLLNTSIGGQNSSKSIQLNTDLSDLNKEVFFWNDEVIILALKDINGYGGYDLYAQILEEGNWGAPINLGPSINTADDEFSPYLCADGRTLYFSSNRLNSIGGLDIYMSRYLYESDAWSKAENVGIPINSAGDERDFRVSFDGLTATFTSDRKLGIGGDDIYLARFKERLVSQNFLTVDLGFIDYQWSGGDAEPASSELETFLVDRPADTSVPTEMIPLNFEMPFLFYREDSELFDKNNREAADQVINILNEQSDLTVEIIGHIGKPTIEEYDIFSSIKLAERVQQYLVDRGIRPARIMTKGMGYNYPIIKNEREGGDDAMAEKYNSRISMRLHAPDDRELEVNQVYPDINEQLFSTKFPLYETLVYNEVSYKIQLIMMNQMYRGRLLRLFNDATIERDLETGLYLYTIGLYDSFMKALQVRRELEREGWADVRVTPYVNGIRLKESELVNYVNDYPELKNMMMNYKE